jgi:hypothetical protein
MPKRIASPLYTSEAFAPQLYIDGSTMVVVVVEVVVVVVGQAKQFPAQSIRINKPSPQNILFFVLVFILLAYSIYFFVF